MQTQTQAKVFDLEERTFIYARSVRAFLKTLRPNEGSVDDKRQLIRSSGSVAANYIEANQAISPRDFALRIRICRKEAKESYLWLRLIQDGTHNRLQIQALIQESLELAKIFGAIANKYKEPL